MMKQLRGVKHWVAIGTVLCLATVCGAQAPEEKPRPSREHELLAQFAGEWTLTAETVAAPGEQAMKAEGTESAKMLGGFWLVGQCESTMAGVKGTSLLTLGYDPQMKKYIGTFVCSFDSMQWKYVGSMDESGRKLTLETEGPSPADPASKVSYREVLELKDKDHKVFTSYMQGEDGKWVKFVEMNYRRKK